MCWLCCIFFFFFLFIKYLFITIIIMRKKIIVLQVHTLQRITGIIDDMLKLTEIIPLKFALGGDNHSSTRLHIALWTAPWRVTPAACIPESLLKILVVQVLLARGFPRLWCYPIHSGQAFPLSLHSYLIVLTLRNKVFLGFSKWILPTKVTEGDISILNT